MEQYIITPPEQPNVIFGMSLPRKDGKIDQCSCQFRLTEDGSLFDLYIGEEAKVRGVSVLVGSPLFIKDGMQLVFERTYNKADYVVNWQKINEWYRLLWQPIKENLKEPINV